MRNKPAHVLSARIKNMDNISILDQIINNQKAEEVANLDAVGELSDRERDVLVRRHGLHGDTKETLESIGSAHNLTRERIRQIETSSVKKLQSLDNLDEYVSGLKKVIYQLMEEHGGLMEKEYLLELLVSFSAGNINTEDENRDVHKNYLNFLITKLLHQEFEEVNNLKHFKESYKLKHQTLEHMEELAEELLNGIKEAKKIHTTENIIKLITELGSYNKHKEKLNRENTIDISHVLGSEHFTEAADLVNNNKPLYSLLKAFRRIEQNNFGHWGINNWREIKPKTINDKIYLVLKHSGKPMHFSKIADRINEVNFDNKIANAATVHNELILDSKYVLVGRGLYGLKDWGYKSGNVLDVIEEILEEAGGPLTRDELIDRVLKRRLVKKATIILALMNKDKFGKVDGRYFISKKEDK